MIVDKDLFRQYVITVEAGVLGQGLIYSVRQPAKNGKDYEVLIKLQELNQAIGAIADLLTLEDIKDKEMSLGAYNSYRTDLFKNIENALKVEKKEAQIPQLAEMEVVV